MEDRCKWFDTDVQAEAILTLGHTNVMSPEASGFRLEAPHAVPSEPARGSGDFGVADAAEAAAPADARAELPPEERVVPLETNEVFVDGVVVERFESSMQFSWIEPGRQQSTMFEAHLASCQRT